MIVSGMSLNSGMPIKGKLLLNSMISTSESKPFILSVSCRFAASSTALIVSLLQCKHRKNKLHESHMHFLRNKVDAWASKLWIACVMQSHSYSQEGMWVCESMCLMLYSQLLQASSVCTYCSGWFEISGRLLIFPSFYYDTPSLTCCRSQGKLTVSGTSTFVSLYKKEFVW